MCSCVPVGLCILPVSMWSTELNMWSDVRGRLLTLRPLSVLSLREWALHKTQSHQYLITFCSTAGMTYWNYAQSVNRLNVKYINNLLSENNIVFFTGTCFCQRLIFDENCWQVNKSSNWNFLMERYTSALSAGHMVFHLSPLHGGGSRKNMQKKELYG